jgi:hypothetical protein
MLVNVDGDIYRISYKQYLDILKLIAECGSVFADGGGVYVNGEFIGGPAPNLSCINAVEAREILTEDDVSEYDWSIEEVALIRAEQARARFVGNDNVAARPSFQGPAQKVLLAFNGSNDKHAIIAALLCEYAREKAHYNTGA